MMGMTSRAAFIFVIWIACIFGSNAKTEDYRNATIECVFSEYDTCYRDIAELGANFTSHYAQSHAEMNASCKSENKAKACIEAIPQKCNSINLSNLSTRITLFLKDLCNNKTVAYNNFLNSSECYNRNQVRRKNCVSKNSAGIKVDAKTLCCSNRNTLRCLQSDLSNVCSANSTSFQNNLEKVYRGHHDALCGPYLKLCNGAAFMSAAVPLIVIAALFNRLVYNVKSE